jgi:hypothetical protein
MRNTVCSLSSQQPRRVGCFSLVSLEVDVERVHGLFVGHRSKARSGGSPYSPPDVLTFHNRRVPSAAQVSPPSKPGPSPVSA